MIRKRFPAHRTVHILSWAGVVTAWMTVIVSRTVGAPGVVVPDAGGDGSEQPTVIGVAPSVGLTSPGVPDLPESGLVIIRPVATVAPEPAVVRQVAPTPAVAPAPVATSSGS